MSFLSEPETWFSLVTASCAVWAVFQTKKQIELSNKHQLFDRRLNNYLAVRDILGCCHEKKDLIDYHSSHIIEESPTSEENTAIALAFIALTSNHYTGNLSTLICNKNDSTRRELMAGIDDISRLATEKQLSSMIMTLQSVLAIF